MSDKIVAALLVLGCAGVILALMLLEGAPLRVAASFAFVVAFLLSFPAIHSMEASAPSPSPKPSPHSNTDPER